MTMKYPKGSTGFMGISAWKEKWWLTTQIYLSED